MSRAARKDHVMRDSVHDTVSLLKRPQLIRLIEQLPQGYMPPRLTRQDKQELAMIVRRAIREGAVPANRVWQLSNS